MSYSTMRTKKICWSCQKSDGWMRAGEEYIEMLDDNGRWVKTPMYRGRHTPDYFCSNCDHFFDTNAFEELETVNY